RTKTENFENADFRTWDAARFLEVSQAHYLNALTLLDALKNYPLADFNPILNSAVENTHIAKTLFDLVNIEVMNFFKSTAHQTAVVEDNSGMSKLFIHYEDFMIDSLKGIDSEAKRLVLARYQDLL